ncbi:protein involved in ribonucleotide reduction [Paenibacillaceae bacterium GAS479]|nr:protein involved in ribonucleotide reduction [Paenibacillaceae bacterium GAS479]
MLIAYTSRTGNVRKFVSKLGYPAVQINESTTVEEPFVLVTYTTGFGEVPPAVDAFLEKNRDYLRGVSASGNRNWGTCFAGSADKVSERYEVPVVCKFELSGTTRDVEQFMREVEPLAAY